MDLQKAAHKALLDGLAAYERRHGWRGKLLNVIAQGQKLDKYADADWDEEPEVNGYMHALVTRISAGAAEVRFGQHTATLVQADVAWTKLKLTNILHPGDIVYIKVLSLDAGGKSRVSLEQDSGAEGALAPIDNATAQIKSLLSGPAFN